MKTLSKYKTYIRAVLFSVLAAFVIDAAVNFDDLKRGFDAGRGKINVVAHATSDSIFKAPEKAAVLTGILYRVIFG